jgi:hypothetical protein
MIRTKRVIVASTAGLFLLLAGIWVYQYWFAPVPQWCAKYDAEGNEQILIGEENCN